MPLTFGELSLLNLGAKRKGRAFPHIRGQSSFLFLRRANFRQGVLQPGKGILCLSLLAEPLPMFELKTRLKSFWETFAS